MQYNKASLIALTEKFLSDFCQMSGENRETYAINFILPEIMYPLLPKYKELPCSIYMPMSYFETNMAIEGMKNRLKGWTNKIKDIVSALESGSEMDFDRYKFDNLTEKEEVKEFIYYNNLKCDKRLETFKIKSFDITSTTYFFKGTVVLTYSNETEFSYPVKNVMLYCNGNCIFEWSVYEENGENSNMTIDASNIKELNAFYYYTT